MLRLDLIYITNDVAKRIMVLFCFALFCFVWFCFVLFPILTAGENVTAHIQEVFRTFYLHAYFY